MAQLRFVPFIPDDTLTMSTNDVAYDNSYGPGHYDGVCSAEKSDFGQTESESTFCSCGKNNQKRGSQASCQQHKDKKSNCPCVKENVCCSRKCKCRNCNNLSKSTAVSPPTKFLRCRCGETTAHRKDTGLALFHAEILKRNPSAHVLVVIKVVQICVDVLTVKMYMVLDYQPNLIVPGV